MPTDRPFALLISWTCYGTWLPGDARGYVSNTLLAEGGFEHKENVPETPCTADDAYTLEHARALQKSDTVYLSPALALVAAQALVDAAGERGWHIVQGAIMANHVHVVVQNCPDDGPAVRRILKGISQNALSRHVGKSQRWWTAGGSDRYKHDDAAICAAVNYVARQAYMLVRIVDMRVEVVQESSVPRRG
jgi:REP element-mobilizing transposase RayT